MKVIVKQRLKLLYTQSYGDYPYSSGIEVFTVNGEVRKNERFSTKENLFADQYIEEQIIDLEPRVWLCRLGDRLMATAIDPKRSEADKWDRVISCIKYDENLEIKNLAICLTDGDYQLGSFPASEIKNPAIQFVNETLTGRIKPVLLLNEDHWNNFPLKRLTEQFCVVLYSHSRYSLAES